MAQKIASSISRRQFLKTAGATTLAAGAGPVVIIPSRAQPKTLRILIGENSWFPLNQLFENFARAWGERKDIRVIVDTAEPSYFSDLVALYAAS